MFFWMLMKMILLFHHVEVTLTKEWTVDLLDLPDVLYQEVNWEDLKRLAESLKSREESEEESEESSPLKKKE